MARSKQYKTSQPNPILAAFLALLGTGLIAVLSLSGHSDDLQLVIEHALPFLGGLGLGLGVAGRHRDP
jgi:hypothetical protein